MATAVTITPDSAPSPQISITPDAAPAPGTTGISGFLNKVGEGGAEAAHDVYSAATGIAPPTQTNAAPSLPGKALGMAEDVASGINNLTGITTVTNSLKSAGSMFDAYEKARSSGGSIMDALHAANEQGKKQDAITPMVKERVAEFQKNPTKETARALADATAMAATVFGGGELAGGETAAAEPEAAETEAAAAPEKPGIIKQVMQGKDVAQPGTQAAVRKAVGAGSEEPILSGDTTVVDKPLADIAKQKSAAYKQIDDTAGFDVKAEKLQLSNDQYKLKQLGNTDADVAQRAKLTDSIADSQQRIADAETKLKAANVDPRAGDVLNTQWKAGQEFRKLLVRSSDAEGNVNVDALLKGSKNLRLVSKYGDRLAQFMGGPENADEFMSKLTEMQKLGAHAAKAQQIAKWVAQYAGLPIAGAVAGYEVLK